MPRKRQETPPTPQEAAFMEAIDRLVRGEPRDTNLRRQAAARKLKINMTTIAVEAGYNRTYLYKNSLPRVMRRIAEAMEETKAPVRTAEDAKKRLQEENADLRHKVKFAVNAARRWMENCFAAEAERDRAIRDRDRLRKQLAEATKSSSAKVVSMFPDHEAGT